MPTDAPGIKAKPPNLDKQQETDELRKLLELVATPPAGVQLSPTAQKDGKQASALGQWPSSYQSPGGSSTKTQTVEAEALEQFSLIYQSERHFTSHVHHQYFKQIFSNLVKQRLSDVSWTESAPPENILRVLVCLRIMMRDLTFQQEFHHLGGIPVLTTYLQKAAESYLTYGEGRLVTDILKELTNIFQKLSALVEQRDSIVSCGAHKSLVLLLSATDVLVLHCSLHALSSLAQCPEPRRLIAELNSIEILLRILQDYDMLSKKLAANLLRLLCADSQARAMVNVYDGIPLLLSLLHSDSVTLLWNVVWCLVQLSGDPDTSNDLRLMGGIPLLLSLLHDRKFVLDRTAANMTVSTPLKSPGLLAEEDLWNLFTQTELREGAIPQIEELREHQSSLKSACCAALTELIVNDTNAQHVVQSNGIYLLGLLILPPSEEITNRDLRPLYTLQANGFRTLRFLFSMERNRRLFKRMFPPELFEKFIDIGHYNRDINAYRPLVQCVNSLSVEILSEINENIKATNQNKPPSHFIGDYAVLELLGSGGFGTVYKVKKRTSGQSYLAMKEINTLNPALGKSSKDREKSIGEIVSELTIIREQLKHPNIVRYYKTFVEQEKLYIVMELIEGAPLGEHFNSLKEKNEKFSEERVWNIFIQLVLALRYLHKEKGIIHRDLKPDNIMLGENDKVTITDFGLAKLKQKDCSKMTSVVGTILYSCPEIVQNEPYGEKADVWAIGCVIYQMCTLNPPFYSHSMLSLATKIVEADYEPIPVEDYSERLTATIKRCITAKPADRPDIVQVAASIADIILVNMDNMRRDHINLEKRLDRERKRTQKHFYEANQNMHNYHRLFQVSQERFDKLVNLASSGGAQSIKDEVEGGDSEFSETDTTPGGVRMQRHSVCGAPPVMSTHTDTDDTHNENGWVSDDELCCSSGSESREGSAGHGGHMPVPRPPEQGTPRSRRKPRNYEHYTALTLDIPSKLSRDSGISSGDPSPNNSSPPSATSSSTNSAGTVPVTPADTPETPQSPEKRQRPKSFSCIQRSCSSTSVDSVVSRSGASGRQRPNSAGKATLTISPRKVRQISDPILQMLHQLHKIIYITQLPPTLCHNPRRRIIERFKRALFAQQTTSMNLKSELKKLLNGSRELIDINFGPMESLGVGRQVSVDQNDGSATKLGGSVYDTEAEDVGITYEQMQSIIESVLVESGYYDMTPGARHRQLPLTPAGKVDTFLAMHAI